VLLALLLSGSGASVVSKIGAAAGR
jgi:hypothetical protein